MTQPRTPHVILMADDDPEDRELVRDALEAAEVSCDFREVADGEELLEYLLHNGRYSAGDTAPLPDLIFLDLNMPRIAGFEALAQIKADARIASIPILVLSTSSTPEQIEKAYASGAQTYLVKPSSFGKYVEAMKSARNYWYDIAVLPER